jgi:diadenosine tetraphosphate (Ap4A) HIT family hydrolase
MKRPGCPLCDETGGALIFSGPFFRVVRADEPGFPAFYRLVWNDHVAELSDLAPVDRRLCIDAVVQVEETLRRVLRPTKINLASLGNAVPHLHWHVIARFDWDSHFPGSPWASALRELAPQQIERVERLRPDVEDSLRTILAARPAK